MKALILAAGYATRLYPLTKNRAKPLLPVGGKPIIDYIVNALSEVSEINGIFVVTNRRFAPSFQGWASSRKHRVPVTVLDDGTTSDDDKLGAIGDIRFAINMAGIDDDLLVVAGDNLFDCDLKEIVRFFRERGPTVAAYDINDRDAAKRYGIVAVDHEGRVIDFVEKPSEPPSTLAAIGLYLYPRRTLSLFDRYAEEGHSQDAPGNFIRWLYKRESVYAFIFTGVWYDIGSLEMYRRADARYGNGEVRNE